MEEDELIDFNSDHRGVWMHGVRLCSGPAYAQDVYPTPPPEKPCIGTANFQPLLLSRYPGGTSGPGCANDLIPAGHFCLHSKSFGCGRSLKLDFSRIFTTQCLSNMPIGC